MDTGRVLSRLALCLAVTAGFLALLVVVAPLGDIRTQMIAVQVDWFYLPLFLAAALGNIYVRGVTLALIVNADPLVGASRWFAISAAHNLGTSLSGLVFGDAFLFWLMYRFGIHWKRSVFTTLLARVFELSPLLLIFLVGLLLVPDLFPGQGAATLLVGLAFLVSVVSLFVLDPLLGRMPARAGLGQGDKVASFRAAYRALTDRCMRSLLVLSYLKIGLSLLYFVFALALFSQELSILQVCVLFGIFNFATALPIQGLAGLGTFEAYFGAGLLLMGWTGAAALALAFQVHMLFLVAFVLLALVGVLLGMFAGGRSAVGDDA